MIYTEMHLTILRWRASASFLLLKKTSNLSTWPQKQTDGNATVILASDCVISYMNFDVLRYEASRMIEIMPPTAAVERAKRFGYRLSGYSNMVISDVALSYTRIAAKSS